MPFDALPAAPTFPATALDTRVELLLGSTWTDITAFCDGGAVQLGRGHPDESVNTLASTLTVPVRNDDGRFSALNPTGPYYGQLGRNTPIRVSLPEGASYLRLEGDAVSYAQTPAGAGPQLVQSQTASGSGAATLTITLASPTTAGNCVVVAIATQNSGTFTISGVTLGGSGTGWASQASVLESAGTPFEGADIWALSNCAGGQTSVVITSSVAVAQMATVYEFTGMPSVTALDKSSTAVSTALSPWSSGTTAATTQASEVWIGAVGIRNTLAVPTLTGPSSPWVNSASTSLGTLGAGMTGYQITTATAAATYSGTATGSGSSSSAAAVITLKGVPPSPLNITGDMDIQLDVTLDNWNQATILAAKWGESTNQRTWLLLLNDTGSLTLVISSNGTATAAVAHSVVPMPLPPLQRMCIRVTYQASTGTVTFYTAPAGLTGAVWTLADQIVTGVTSLFAGAAAVQLGYGTDVADLTSAGVPGINGKIHAFQLLNGIAGSVVANPDFTAQTAGATSFADGHSNTWTLAGTAEISNRKYRFHGEIPEWPQAWSPVSANVYVTATAGGLLRRFGRAQQPVKSAMARAYTRLPASLNLAAYWPAEDGSGATQIGQSVGTHAMTSAGLTMASSSVFACSNPLPVMNGATATAVVDPNSVAWTDNVVRFLLAIPAGDDTNGAVVCQFSTLGTVATVQLIYTTGSNLTLNAYNAAGTLVFTNTTHFVNNPLVGRQVRVSVELLGSGHYNVWVLPPGGGSTGFGSTFAGAIGGITSVAFGGGLVSSAMGHFSVQGVSDAINNLGQPLNAWMGETAGARFSRLCGEEGVTFRGRGRLAATVPMGAQTPQTLTALLQECANADRGVWYETRQVLGWGYRTSAIQYNQPVAVPLSYTQNMLKWPLETTEDDQTIINDVTASRTGGSSVRIAATTGALSTAAPSSGGAGVYDTSVNVNVASDSQLADQASWSVHLGTVNEPRYPAINLDLTETGPLAALWYQILDADLGDRIQIATPPGWLPPGPIDQHIQDAAETYDSRQLDITWAGVPASPWNVATADDAVLGHCDTAGCVMHVGATFGAGTIQVDTTLGPLWTTSGADYPFDLTIAGMTITVSACSGAANPQILTVSAWGVNGVTKNLLAGQDVRLAHPMILALT